MSFCYLTTTGRISGEPRTIEIWFARDGPTVYLLSGGGRRANWVRNIERDPSVSVRLGPTTHPGTARIVEGRDEDAKARRLLLEKYQPGYGGDLTGWSETALPVAIDLGAAS